MANQDPILEMLGKLNDKFDSLSTENKEFNHKLDSFDHKLNAISEENKAISAENKEIIADNKRFNTRFDDYQKATQWVVQLAFSLIASATITVIITSVLRK